MPITVENLRAASASYQNAAYGCLGLSDIWPYSRWQPQREAIDYLFDNLIGKSMDLSSAAFWLDDSARPQEND